MSNKQHDEPRDPPGRCVLEGFICMAIGIAIPTWGRIKHPHEALHYYLYFAGLVPFLVGLIFVILNWKDFRATRQMSTEEAA